MGAAREITNSTNSLLHLSIAFRLEERCAIPMSTAFTLIRYSMPSKLNHNEAMHLTTNVMGSLLSKYKKHQKLSLHEWKHKRSNITCRVTLTSRLTGNRELHFLYKHPIFSFHLRHSSGACATCVLHVQDTVQPIDTKL